MKTKRKPKAKPTKPKIDPIEAARIDEVFKATAAATNCGNIPVATE